MNNSISFADSQEAIFRRSVRRSVRTSPLTKGQRDVLMAFMNHWMHHRKSKDGMVHPGREKIAKKAGVTIKTVSRLFEVLRFYDVISAEAHLNGLNGCATLYSVNTIRFFEFCAMKRDDVRNTVGQMSRVGGGTKCPAVLDDASNVVPFTKKGSF